MSDEFWANVDRSGDCWLWLGATQSASGGFRYGKFKSQLAHRYSWALTNGPIPTGLFVCHHCDVPLCVRPEHLFVGTQADNMRDMAAKGRSCVGERHGNAKLTWEDVESIRRRYEPPRSRDWGYATRSKRVTLKSLAEEYGVDVKVIHKIVQGRAWSRRPVQGGACPLYRVGGQFHTEARVQEFQIRDMEVWTRFEGEDEWVFDPGNTAMRERLAAKQTSTQEGRREA